MTAHALTVLCTLIKHAQDVVTVYMKKGSFVMEKSGAIWIIAKDAQMVI